MLLTLLQKLEFLALFVTMPYDLSAIYPSQFYILRILCFYKIFL